MGLYLPKLYRPQSVDVHKSTGQYWQKTELAPRNTGKTEAAAQPTTAEIPEALELSASDTVPPAFPPLSRPRRQVGIPPLEDGGEAQRRHQHADDRSAPLEDPQHQDLRCFRVLPADRPTALREELPRLLTCWGLDRAVFGFLDSGKKEQIVPRGTLNA